MSEKFRERYHIGTNRCPGHDYSAPGIYFITICTRKKLPYFGEIVNYEMLLSGTGILVRNFWLVIPDHFPNVKLDEYVIMPDHLHGIIIIKSEIGVKSKCNIVEMPNLGVSTEGIEQVGKLKNIGNPNWKSNSIGSIINQYKRICTIKSKSFGLDLVWQPRYYDHIIRSESELNRIRSYIKNNPKEFHE